MRHLLGRLLKARLVRALCVWALVLVALEGLAAQTDGKPKLRWSASTGFELIPGYRGRHESVNALGLRGAEVGPRRPGVLRILCMGGSTTWGHKVADDETWPVHLQDALGRRLGRPVEVLNGGVSGWGLEQVLRRLQDGLLRQVQPDLVLVFSGWNYPWIADNPLIRDTVRRFAGTPDAAPPSRWALARRLVRWSEDWRSTRTAADVDAVGARAVLADALAEAFPRLCPELRRTCEAQGARLALIRFPALVQRQAPEDADARAAYEAVVVKRDPGGDPDALAAAEREIHAHALVAVEAGARAAALPLLDVAAHIEAALPADPAAADAAWPLWWRDFAHFEPEGNHAFAETLAGLLTEQPELLEARDGD